MAWSNANFITLADLYVAYRKAKVDAFYERTQPSALAFARYEVDLPKRLERLLDLINDPEPRWFSSERFLGRFRYVPKSVDAPADLAINEVHFHTCDAIEDWRRAYEKEGKLFDAAFRLVINPSIDFHVISALWILKVGHRFDARLDPEHSYGNRLRRERASDEETLTPGRINREVHGFFAPYFSAYRQWRERGLNAMRDELKNDRSILALTMDIQRFYHRVDRRFLLSPDFLKAIDVKLNRDESTITDQILQAMRTWAAETPDHANTPDIGLPVGLSASKIISNVLLNEFDVLVRDELSPVYYGRYVDDIFLVLRCRRSFKTGEEVLRWLARRLEPQVRFDSGDGEHGSRLVLELSYAGESELVFAGHKLKIFPLKGQSGLDLVEQLSGQISKQSSERRMLPDLPDDEALIANNALLATPEESLDADALRKADAVSLRRFGFSVLLGNAEAHARDLPTQEWAPLRERFIGLVERHVLTPRGFFDYAAWSHRAFGLILACGDFPAALEFLGRFEKVLRCLQETTTAGAESSSEQCTSAVGCYVDYFTEAALQAATLEGFSRSASFRRVLDRLGTMSSAAYVPRNQVETEDLIQKLLVSDLGRRPYRQYWTSKHKAPNEAQVRRLPASVLEAIRFREVRQFREAANLPPPHLCVYFPTRPLALPDITELAPGLLNDDTGRHVRDALYGLRGVRLKEDEMPAFVDTHELNVPTREREYIRVAVTNWLTTDADWDCAARGRPRLTLERYRRLNRMVNQILEEPSRPDYIVLPELSLPRRWAGGISRKLSARGISLIAGLEYERRGKQAANEVLISLVTNAPGYNTFVSLKQTKLAAAYDEARRLRQKVNSSLTPPPSAPWDKPVYVHGKFCFGVLICSDLTSIQNRGHFQGLVDSLFVVEWNQDLPTFGLLVDSAAHDVHAFIVQANNRKYGDSRIRGPFREEHRRDVVRVRGGVHDYFVVGQLDFLALRRFQSDHEPSDDGEFKPFPIGFRISPRRHIAGSDQ
jgi:hypothetical protein